MKTQMNYYDSMKPQTLYRSAVISYIHLMTGIIGNISEERDLDYREMIELEKILDVARQEISNIDERARRRWFVWPLRSWDSDPYRSILLFKIKYFRTGIKVMRTFPCGEVRYLCDEAHVAMGAVDKSIG